MASRPVPGRAGASRVLGWRCSCPWPSPAVIGPVPGLTPAGASRALPGGHTAAAPDPQVTVAAQTAAEPVALDRSSLRASRSRQHLPMKRVLRTVAVGPTFSGQASWYGGSFQG